jgi:hypothetical protein
VRPLIFVDLEASGLGPFSFPIEVGWCTVTGEGEAHLIRPAPEWTDWCPASEKIHGITREQLAERGSRPRRSCAVSNRHSPRKTWRPYRMRPASLAEKRREEARRRAADKTFRQVAEMVIADKVRDGEWTSPRAKKTWESSLDRYVHPFLGDMHPRNIQTEHVVEMLGRIWNRIPETASRVRGRTERILKKAKSLKLCRFQEGCSA